ncbi:MAG: hypothetical protein C5B54_10885 [Acidobacteria bacterium]|nr:MAG: hypothetical protein C5B54_10885 [Acidobacteriota bacterium]
MDRQGRRSPFNGRSMKSAIILLFFLLTSSFAFAQRETGAIEGTITDSDAHSIPGVIVTASSSSLIGGSRTAFTNASGFYRFPVLAPGTYEVKAELNGFQTIARNNISLSINTTLTTDFTLQLLQTSETVLVTAEPLIDTTTTSVTSTVPPAIISNLPRRPDIQSLIALTPGVSDDLVAFGAENNQNTFWVDGVNMTNARENALLLVQYDQNWIDQVQVIGIGAPAEYGAFTGVLANVVTKSGGNDFHGMFETFFQNDKMTSRNDQHSVRGISTIPPFKTYDISTQLGGPIQKDKIWFFSGFQYPHQENPGTASNPGLAISTAGKMLNKLTYKWNDNNNLQGFLQFNQGSGDNLNYNYPDLNTSYKDPEWSWNTTWTSILTPQTNLEARIGGFYEHYRDTEDRPDIPGHYDYGTGMESVNNRARLTNINNRFQSTAVLSHHAENFLHGNHEFRFGVQFTHTYNLFQYDYNGSMFYYDMNGAPYSRIIFPVFAYPAHTRTMTTYAEDEWNITDRFTASLGVRWDKNRGGTDLGTFHKNDPVAPRVGFIWKLNRESRTVIKAHYGHYFETLLDDGFITEGQLGDIIYQQYQDGNWVEVGRGNHLDHHPLIPHDLKQPFMRQVDAGVDQVLPGAVPIGVHYIYRQWENLIDQLSLNADTDWAQVPFIDPVNGQTFFLELLKPGVENKGTILTNPPWMFRRYNAIELYGSKQLRHRVSFMASLVYSDLRGNDVGYRPDPNYAQGKLMVDRPLQWKVSGTAPFPWGFNAGWYFRHESGNTWAAQFSFPPIPGCMCDQIAFSERPGSRQLPSKNVVDLRFEKGFSVHKGQLWATIDVFNLFNNATPIGVVSDYSNPKFGKYGAFIDPRKCRVGVRYIF